MTPDQTNMGATIIGIILVIVVAYWVFRRKKIEADPPKEISTSIQIAHLKEELHADTSDGCVGAFLVLALLGFSAYSYIRYAAADNVYGQMAALLLWIGNCAFWGIFIITFVLARRRIFVVYRDASPAAVDNRREPSFFTDQG